MFTRPGATAGAVARADHRAERAAVPDSAGGSDGKPAGTVAAKSAGAVAPDGHPA